VEALTMMFQWLAKEQIRSPYKLYRIPTQLVFPLMSKNRNMRAMLGDGKWMHALLSQEQQTGGAKPGSKCDHSVAIPGLPGFTFNYMVLAPGWTPDRFIGVSPEMWILRFYLSDVPIVRAIESTKPGFAELKATLQPPKKSAVIPYVLHTISEYFNGIGEYPSEAFWRFVNGYTFPAYGTEDKPLTSPVTHVDVGMLPYVKLAKGFGYNELLAGLKSWFKSEIHGDLYDRSMSPHYLINAYAAWVCEQAVANEDPAPRWTPVV